MVLNLMFVFDAYDKEILSILEDLRCSLNTVKNQPQISDQSVCTEQCSLSGSFVSDTVFNQTFLLILK